MVEHNRVRLYGKLTEGSVVTNVRGNYYIATVWTVSLKGDGNAHDRTVIRRSAESVEEFKARIVDEAGNREVVIGPVGLSKDQKSR